MAAKFFKRGLDCTTSAYMTAVCSLLSSEIGFAYLLTPDAPECYVEFACVDLLEFSNAMNYENVLHFYGS